MSFAPQRCTFSTSEPPKVVRTPSALYIFTSKCASRHNGVHFFDIWTSKSGARLKCFVYFHFEMCFAPQRRALFRHLNLQKWCEAQVFCTFSLRNVLRATTACTFLTSHLPKVVRPWCALHILTSKCAPRQNSVLFFISRLGQDGSAPAALASLLFDPPEPQIIGKTQCFATFLPFRASALSFFWLFLFSDLLSSNLSLLSASALLCFSSVHIVGNLTSKLPSIMKHHVLRNDLDTSWPPNNSGLHSPVVQVFMGILIQTSSKPTKLWALSGKEMVGFGGCAPCPPRGQMSSWRSHLPTKILNADKGPFIVRLRHSTGLNSLANFQERICLWKSKKCTMMWLYRCMCILCIYYIYICIYVYDVYVYKLWVCV